MAVSAEPAWTPGPNQPVLAEGAVHVWRADLAEVAGELGELLNDDERARAERLVSERDAERWRRARGLLRALLGRYLEEDPRSLRFATGEHGKPAVARDTSDQLSATRDTPASRCAELQFNMSHSGPLALYAFSAAGAVGVDVEIARHPIDEVAIAARTLGELTARRLAELDPDRRRYEFLRAWARHEAELKCLGSGIGGTGVDRGAYKPLVVALELGPDAAGAVATQRTARELRHWDWRAAAR
jgi:4'-phosphopantetheinyl transferase